MASIRAKCDGRTPGDRRVSRATASATSARKPSMIDMLPHATPVRAVPL